MVHLLGMSAVLVQGQPSPSPVPGLLLIASIVGVVVDYRYKKAGGRKPSSRDRIFFLIVVLAIAGLIIWAASYNSEIAGMILVPIVIWLFFAWEVGRWRIRRKYPLPIAQKPEQPPTSEQPPS